jgi:hypothetical protein
MYEDDERLNFDITNDASVILERSNKNAQQLDIEIFQRQRYIETEIDSIEQYIYELQEEIETQKNIHLSPNICDMNEEKRSLERQRAVLFRELYILQQLQEDMTELATEKTDKRNKKHQKRMNRTTYLGATVNAIIAAYHIMYGVKILSPLFVVICIWFILQIETGDV